MTACGFDADRIASALGGAGDASTEERALTLAHVAECSSCREIANVHRRARTTWSSAMARDELAAYNRRERRLEGVPARPRKGRFELGPQFVLGAALGATMVGLWLGRTTPPPVASSSSPPAAFEQPSAVSPGNLPPSPLSPIPEAPKAAVVAARGCAECSGQSGAVRAGAPLDGDAISVPRGATLLLGWSMSDPSSGADVLGPSRVHVTDGAVVLERGTAVADTRARGELRTPVLTTVGSQASWRVDVQGDRTRVTVLRGLIEVSTRGEPTRTLREGESVDVSPSVAPPPASSSPPAALANPAPEAPAAAAPAPAVPVDPNERLNVLVGGADDGAAFEAARTLVASSSTLSVRAGTWRRFLARDRRHPYADQAMAELANVLLDMRDDVAARVVVDTLVAMPPAPEARAAFEHARARLADQAAVEVLDRDVHKLPLARPRRP